MEYFLERKKRTVNIKIDPGKTPIDLYDFVAERGVFKMTFASEDSARLFMSRGDFWIKGRFCKITRPTQQNHKVRVHWAPHYLPDPIIVEEVEKISGVRVYQVFHEKSNREGLKHVHTNVRTFVVQAENIDVLSQFM